jgi:hypothetical protein
MNKIRQKVDIKNKIFTLRNVQVILDKDLSILYNVENRVLKQSVKRNLSRFPNDFMFEATNDEIDFMVSQSVIPSKQHLGGAKPFLFTEQGVASLSGILNSDIAIQINIEILRAFVNMRKFLASNGELFQRLELIEKRQITYELKIDNKFEKIFNALEDKSLTPKQGIFFDGQIFDAYAFISSLIKEANKSIIILDNYIDESVLIHLSKAPLHVNITILTKNISKQLKLDIQKYNQQYKNLTIKEFKNSHDRFIIIDKKEIYHIGASLKDLGKKWFAFSLLEKNSFGLMDKIEEIIK